MIDAGIQESAAGRPTGQMERTVRPRVHLCPRSAVPLAVGPSGRVVADRGSQKAGVWECWGRHNRCALNVRRDAWRRFRHIPRVRVVAVVLRDVAVGPRSAVAVAGLVQVGVEARGSVRVDVAEDGQLSGAGEVRRARARAQGQKGGCLALVAHNRGRCGTDRYRPRSTEDLDECQRQVVRCRVLELVTVELRVSGDHRERVAAGERVRIRVLPQRSGRAHECEGVVGSLDAGVDPKVALVKRHRLVDRESEVAVVLVPVACREGCGVDRRLLVAAVDVSAAGVDGEAEHAEQDEDKQRDQNDRLALLQAALARSSWSTRLDKPHMQ